MKPLEWSFIQGQVYFRVDKDRLPCEYELAYTALPVGLTLYEVRHVVVSNLIVQGFQLDGVNAHDNVFDTSLIGLTCRGKGRSGISIGGASRVRLESCLVGDNGAAQVRTEGSRAARSPTANCWKTRRRPSSAKAGLSLAPVMRVLTLRMLGLVDDALDLGPGRPVIHDAHARHRDGNQPEASATRTPGMPLVRGAGRTCTAHPSRTQGAESRRSKGQSARHVAERHDDEVFGQRGTEADNPLAMRYSATIRAWTDKAMRKTAAIPSGLLRYI